MSDRFAISYTPEFASVLREINCSLAISTYQAGKVIFICPGEKFKLLQIPASFKKPMGLAFQNDQMAVATVNEIHIYSKNRSMAGSFAERPGFYDALYLPRAVFCCGDTDLHDLSFGEGGLWAVNTMFSCLSTFDVKNSFSPRWKPPFISEICPEDRCHLNGMVMLEGLPKFVTALSKTDQKGGWRENITETGLIMEVPSGKILFDQLPMPHSPRISGGYLYVLLSASGAILKINLKDKTSVVIAETGRFIRGLAIHGKYLFIGSSKVRKTSKTFGKLAFREESSFAGILVYDTELNVFVADLKYLNTVEEIYDVMLLPATMRPGLMSFRDKRAEMIVTTPEKIFFKKSKE
ncbi:hypothetical protein SDC9_46021 [bioreactor metagenome]|uniref:Conserved hypothetical protein CHP03032 domain-containing protein n=1 Tax=bioreactor metagenome TaxID=1076179 RepID=A0A644W8J4_9ZZZZ